MLTIRTVWPLAVVSVFMSTGVVAGELAEGNLRASIACRRDGHGAFRCGAQRERGDRLDRPGRWSRVNQCACSGRRGDRKPYSKITVFLKPERVTGEAKVDLSRGLPATAQELLRGVDLAVLKIVNPPANLPVVVLRESNGTHIG
ncbi:MAG: hypothetical protein U0231_00610 [Nitrospiraceae bacterium]